MNIPTRLLVLQRLKALFTDTPLVYKGNPVDMKGCVESGRSVIGEESIGLSQLPYINILENPRPDIGYYAGLDLEARNDHWTLLVQGVVEDDPAYPMDNAYWFYAAMEERLALMTLAQRGASGSLKNAATYMLGSLITSLEINAPVIRPAENKAQSSRAIVFLPLRVGIATVMGQPYTSVP